MAAALTDALDKLYRLDNSSRPACILPDALHRRRSFGVPIYLSR